MASSRLSQHWRGIGETDNLAELSKLDEHIILDELRARYENDNIYTYVGDILISVNPFKDLPIYEKKISQTYKTAQLDRPHIYAVAAHVYKCMLGDGDVASHSDQCIVISGESGAGKTESTKLVVKQIIEICNGNTQLEQQILQVNPLLEAFGNAKTVINGNSSRFGKYIQILFTSGRVVGAKISEYLLEKSRVVQQNAGDANFHIFSYILAGCSPEQKSQYKLKKQRDYRYTRGETRAITEHDLQGKFEELQNSMDLVGFSEEEQDDLLLILSGVLAIGNVNFGDSGDDGAVAVTYPEDLELVAELFGIHEKDLSDCLTSITNKAGGEQIQKHFTKHQAEDARDAVAKVIYGRLFSWIVNKINQRLSPAKRSANQKEIGILDIFGFENFLLNSFEQACINLANEHLQFFFNEHIFSLEQDEYKSEGIKWTHISYSDNQPLLDLFLKRPIGILALLDEESHFPRATDSTLVQKLNSNLKSRDSYKTHKSVGKPCFTIKHYAGEVTYNVTSWLEKNRDTVPPTLMTILKHSSNELLRTIFKGTITRTGTLALQNRTRKSMRTIFDELWDQRPGQPVAPSNTKKFTVGTQFKNSLQELIKHMSQAEPHFIRCLKPNNRQEANKFDDAYVLSQLSYTGMLQTVQIRRDGYALRPLIPDFISMYKPLLFNGDVPVDTETCKQILRRAELKDWHIGKTKVFLKSSHGEVLAAKLFALGKSVTKLQAVARGFLARRYVVKRREVSRQQREYAQAFIRSIYDHNEELVSKQQDLRKCEQEQREENSRKEKQELAKKSAVEAAKAAAKAAEEKEAVVRLRPKPASRPSSAVQSSRDSGTSALQVRPPKPPRLSHVDTRTESKVQEDTRMSKFKINIPSQQPPPQFPLPPTPPVRARHVHNPPISAKKFSDFRNKSVVDKFSKFGDGAADDDEVLEDDFSASHQVQTTPYGPIGTRQATIEWFRATQLAKLVKPSGQLYEWFHGMVPRGKAEQMLAIRGVGGFMIRISERRFGYVLSFRAENRCRHYMVDPTPSNKYVVVGEAKVHKTLSNLVAYHKQHVLSNWNGVLTEVCDQADSYQPDYMELLPTTSDRMYLNPISPQSDQHRSSNGGPPPLPPKVKAKPPPKFINYK